MHTSHALTTRCTNPRFHYKHVWDTTLLLTTSRTTQNVHQLALRLIERRAPLCSSKCRLKHYVAVPQHPFLCLEALVARAHDTTFPPWAHCPEPRFIMKLLRTSFPQPRIVARAVCSEEHRAGGLQSNNSLLAWDAGCWTPIVVALQALQFFRLATSSNCRNPGTCSMTHAKLDDFINLLNFQFSGHRRNPLS